MKQLQRSGAIPIGNPDAAWALVPQGAGALALAHRVESERSRKEILASNEKLGHGLVSDLNALMDESLDILAIPQ